MASKASPTLTAARQSVVQAQARVGQAQAAARLPDHVQQHGVAFRRQRLPAAADLRDVRHTAKHADRAAAAWPASRLAVTQAQEQRARRPAQLDSAPPRAGRAGGVRLITMSCGNKRCWPSPRQTLTEDRRALGDVQKRSAAGDAAQLDVLQAQVPGRCRPGRAGRGRKRSCGRRRNAEQPARPAAGQLRSCWPTSRRMLLLCPTRSRRPKQFALTRSPDLRAAEATIRADRGRARRRPAVPRAGVSLQAIDIRSKDVTSFSERGHRAGRRYSAAVRRRPRQSAGPGSPGRAGRGNGAGGSRPAHGRWPASAQHT